MQGVESRAASGHLEAKCKLCFTACKVWRRRILDLFAAGSFASAAEAIERPARLLRRSRPDAFRFRRKCPRWIEIFVQRLRFRSRTPPGGDGRDPYHAHCPPLCEGQDIRRLNNRGGFFRAGAINAHAPVSDRPRGKATRLEEPRVPQPTVKTVSRAARRVQDDLNSGP